MGKVIIELIGNLVEITGNSYVDGALIAIVGLISYAIVFNLVGKLFDAIGFYDSDIMSDVHWIIRVGVFCGVTYILIKIIEFVTWLFSLQWWIYIITFLTVIIGVLCAYYIRYKIRKQKNTCRETNNKENLETKKDIEAEIYEAPMNVYSRFNCPRCNAQLVKRHGPYGDFYGCEAYGQTGCRYTRKYL